jgi:hypothetical protein
MIRKSLRPPPNVEYQPRDCIVAKALHLTKKSNYVEACHTNKKCIQVKKIRPFITLNKKLEIKSTLLSSHSILSHIKLL